MSLWASTTQLNASTFKNDWQMLRIASSLISLLHCKEPVAEFKSTAVLPYVQGVSKPLRRCLEQQCIRTVFKSETTLRSHLVRPEDTVDPAKRDGVVYRIPCECGKVYIGETGPDLCMRESKSTIGIYHSPVPRPPPFLITPARPAIIRFGTRKSLLIETLTGTPVGSRKLSI